MVDRLKDAAIGAGLAIGSLAIVVGLAFLMHVAEMQVDQNGPVCVGGIMLSLVLLVGALLGVQLGKDV